MISNADTVRQIPKQIQDYTCRRLGQQTHPNPQPKVKGVTLIPKKGEQQRT